jgi:hypothetical protein
LHNRILVSSLLLQLSQSIKKMNCYMSLRIKAANEGSPGTETDWCADEQLSQRAQVDSQDEC